MRKFDKILVETILCCFLDGYLILVICDHFHFVYFGDQCEMMPIFCQNYDFRLLPIRVSEL